MRPFRRSIYKSPAQLRQLVEPGLVTARALRAALDAVAPGATTLELDAIAEASIRAAGGVPNFMKEPGYHHTLCVSVNDEVVHGVPGGRVLEPGDVVSIDCGAEVGGWNGDSAATVVVPSPGADLRAGQELNRVTEQSLWHGIAALSRAAHLNEVGAAIEDYIRSQERDGVRYGILEDYVGHGIGRSMHEDPPVFNYRVKQRGPEVKPGLVIAIEPMVTLGTIETVIEDDAWTITTEDGSLAAHWEHSVAVHDKGIWVLTAEDGGAEALAPLGVRPVPVA